MVKKLQILRGTTAQNDAYTGSIGELTMDTEKVEVRIHDGTTQGGKTIGAGGGASLPILTHVFSDHKLNDISWLNSDTFSWQSGDVYVAAFEHLVADAESGGLVYGWSSKPDAMVGFDRYTKTRHPVVGEKFYTSSVDGWVETGVTVTQIIDENTVVDSQGITRYCLSYSMLGTDSIEETIEGIQIKYLRADDGHKICMLDQEANVQALYEKTGVAWYYILDTANKRFKLPRTKFGFTGLRDAVGGYVGAGLPNITGTFAAIKDQTESVYSGAFYDAGQNGGTNHGTSWYDTGRRYGLDASRSSSVYGNSNTVQPKATQMYLYFYVGNFEREAVEQTAGLNAEMFNDKADVSLLENKANTDLSNLTSVGKNKLGPKIYRVTGKLINSIADTVEGYGVAEVYLYPNGIALIEFSIQCTKSGTSTSYFDWGINRDLIHSLNQEIPIITPKGGNETYYAANGNIAADRTGYGGTLTAVSQFWQPGRVYNLDGAVGGWPAGNFVVNQRVVGTAWGTYEI